MSINSLNLLIIECILKSMRYKLANSFQKIANTFLFIIDIKKNLLFRNWYKCLLYQKTNSTLFIDLVLLTKLYNASLWSNRRNMLNYSENWQKENKSIQNTTSLDKFLKICTYIDFKS